MTLSYDSVPDDVRRLNFGWFGEPWPSAICYDENDILNEAMRIPTPVGELCLGCAEAIEEGDRGKAMPMMGEHPRITYMHRECLFRNVVGPLKHVRGECPGIGKCHDDTGMTLRQEAIAVWEHVIRNPGRF